MDQFRNFVVVSVGLLLFFVASTYAVRAQQAACAKGDEQCWRKELAKVEEEIKQKQEVLQSKQRERVSLERDVAILDAKIDEAKLKIRARTIAIENLSKNISSKIAHIGTLNERIDRGRSSLGQLLRKTEEIDSLSVPEIILGNNDLSEALVDVDSYEAIKTSLAQLFEEIRANKTQTEAEKNILSKKRSDEVDAKVEIEAQKKIIEKSEAEKKVLVASAKQQEKSYQQIIAEREAKAAGIRSMLFALRDTDGIKFGDALVFAQKAQKRTGVRPAFLLAILMQETNLGKNLGSCYVTDLTTGDGKGINTGAFFEKVMAPSRSGDVKKGDTIYFEKILSALGRDWKTTRVSCPIGGNSYYVGRGFGGAMGPAQFIPSTWVGLQSEVASVVGRSKTDPWNPEDAFAASSIYLSWLGASGGGYSGEINAACKYFSGSACTSATGKRNAGYSYGEQVMAKAKNIQETMIDPLGI